MYLVKQKTVNYFEGFNQVQRPTDMSKCHSEQLKQETAAYDLSNKDKPVKAIAQSLGIGCSTLENWVRKASGTVRRELRNDQQRIRQPERENAPSRRSTTSLRRRICTSWAKPRQ